MEEGRAGRRSVPGCDVPWAERRRSRSEVEGSLRETGGLVARAGDRDDSPCYEGCVEAGSCSCVSTPRETSARGKLASCARGPSTPLSLRSGNTRSCASTPDSHPTRQPHLIPNSSQHRLVQLHPETWLVAYLQITVPHLRLSHPQLVLFPISTPRQYLTEIFTSRRRY